MPQTILSFAVKPLYTLVLLFVLLGSSLANAWPPTYGAEFELYHPSFPGFTSKDDPTNSPEHKAQMKYAELMTQKCIALGCVVEKVSGKWGVPDYKVTYSDGWWFKISFDPICVEITFKPSSLQELNSKKDIINQHIFETGKEMGLGIAKNRNSHFNIGINSAFDGNARNFLKFFVDYANHPDLTLGSLGYKDINNSPPLSILDKEQREALNQVIADFEAGRLRTVAEVARAIQERVYTASFNKSWGGIHHYQAVGLKYVNRTNLEQKDAPFELRSVWAQKSAEQFNLVAQLIEARINYLKSSNNPIIYSALERIAFNNTELKSRFYIYVEEAGLKYSDYESLLPEVVRRAPLDHFTNPGSSAINRLNAIEAYWDLIPVSEWVRNRVVETLADPSLKKNPLKKRLMARLQQEAMPAPAAAASAHQKSRWEVLKDFLFINSSQSATAQIARDAKQQLWFDMINDISNGGRRAHPAQQTAPSCRTLF